MPGLGEPRDRGYGEVGRSDCLGEGRRADNYASHCVKIVYHSLWQYRGGLHLADRDTLTEMEVVVVGVLALVGHQRLLRNSQGSGCSFSNAVRRI